MQTLIQDIRYGMRMMLKKPGFTLIAIVTLALGIGANAAIFSVVDTVLLRPLPFKESDRLMMLNETKLPQFPSFSVAPGNFLAWKKQSTVFEQLVAFNVAKVNLTNNGEPEQLMSLNVTDGFFSMLGAAPLLGRNFLSEEDQPGRNNVVILSYKLWQSRFGANQNILHQSITLNGQNYNVIGVMPQDFRFLIDEVELWTPMAFTPEQTQNHGGHSLIAVGKIKAGISLEQAQAEMRNIGDRLAQEYPEANAGWNVKITPLLEFMVARIKPALLILLAAVAFVLLIACANVANLLLVRAAGRQKEISIRAALGAGRWHIIRQLLTESLMLALLGGTLGLLLANWGLDLLLRLAPQDLPRLTDVALDRRVVLFTLFVTLLTGVIFGLIPALQAANPNLNEAMKDAGRGSTESGGRKTLRNTLVVIEVAAALILLVGAGLLMKSFWRLQNVNPGFNTENALALTVTLPEKKYKDAAQQVTFFQQLIENLRALPGVQSVGATSTVPISGGDFLLEFGIQGRPVSQPGAGLSTMYYSVSADYFKTMSIPLVRGRYFTEHDTKDASKVAIISEAMAKKIFPNEDPIGKAITFDVNQKNPAWFEIVGIVGDVKQYGLDRETPIQTYEPFTQQTLSSMSLIVRTSSDPLNLTTQIRNEVLRLDKEQPIAEVKTLNQFVSISIAQRQFSVLLLGIFASVAMLLAAIGIFGVLSYTVTQRTSEIGIRMALGAGRNDVLKLVVGHGMFLTLLGIATGLLISFGLTRVMATLLFEVSATDPLTFTGISILLIVVALFACLIPAWRATKVDPMIALRCE